MNNFAESVDSSPAVVLDANIDETSESVHDLPTESKIDEESNKVIEEHDNEVKKVVVPFTAEQPSDERRGHGASQMSIRPSLKRPSAEVSETRSKRERHHALTMRAQNDPDVIREIAASRGSTRGRSTQGTTTPRAPKE